MKTLKGATIASTPITSLLKTDEEVNAPILSRGRGLKGREEALERGLELKGDGPHGGLKAALSGQNVVLYGLPGSLQPLQLREYLRGFKFSARESEKTQVQKLLG
jgi:hypothetical protein